MKRITSPSSLLVAMALASCGGSASSTGTAAPATSVPAGDRASYVARADALCATANAQQTALRRRVGGLSSAKLPPILHQQAQIASTLHTGLAKLTAPAADRTAVGRFIGAVNQLSVYSTAIGNSLAAGHTYAARALAAKLNLARQQETLLAQGYGYKTCGSGKAY